MTTQYMTLNWALMLFRFHKGKDMPRMMKGRHKPKTSEEGLRQRIENLKWAELPNPALWATDQNLIIDETLTELDKTYEEIENRQKVALKIMKDSSQPKGIRQANKLYEYAYRNVLKALDNNRRPK